MDYVSHPVGIARVQGAQNCPEKLQPWRCHWPVGHEGSCPALGPLGEQRIQDHKGQRNYSPGPEPRQRGESGGGGAGGLRGRGGQLSCK